IFFGILRDKFILNQRLKGLLTQKLALLWTKLPAKHSGVHTLEAFRLLAQVSFRNIDRINLCRRSHACSGIFASVTKKHEHKNADSKKYRCRYCLGADVSLREVAFHLFSKTWFRHLDPFEIF